MKFKVIRTPSHCEGLTGDFSVLRVGDVVEVDNPTPDSDGDVNFVFPGEAWNHIALSCLKPFEDGVVQISAVRAALVALGIESDVVAVAQAIEAAVA